MKKGIISLCLLVLLGLACNISKGPAPTVTPVAPSATSTTAASATPLPSATTAPTATPVPPTPTTIPADVPFLIDCSALPELRKVDCDAFITATRDQVYPLLREVTGISFSQCYTQGISYTILTTDPHAGAGGVSDGDQITYNQKYSVDLKHRYDVHEILHSLSTCGRALDEHIFHGMVMNYVYDRLGVHDAGYFTAQDSQDLTGNLDFLLENVKKVSGKELRDNCRGILIRRITRAYFDLGPEAVRPLYQSPFSPPASAPSALLVSVWDTHAGQIQALLEALQREYHYSLDVPECGY